MKLCKNCFYYETKSGRCKKQPDYSTGDAVALGKGWRGSTTLQREDGFFWSFFNNSCGKRARWFKSAN